MDIRFTNYPQTGRKTYIFKDTVVLSEVLETIVVMLVFSDDVEEMYHRIPNARAAR